MKVALFKEFEKLLDLLCSMESDICHFAQTRDKNATYRSTTTTSEFMYPMDNILDHEVSTRLRCSINEYGAYTIMADETSINNKSFLGVYARFLEESDGRVKTVEELLFITAVTSTKAEALFVAINFGLSSRNITTNCLKCVSFDGASVMSSADKGLYGLMKCHWNLHHLIYQHWKAHGFNWLLKELARISLLSRTRLLDFKCSSRFFIGAIKSISFSRSKLLRILLLKAGSKGLWVLLILDGCLILVLSRALWIYCLV